MNLQCCLHSTKIFLKKSGLNLYNLVVNISFLYFNSFKSEASKFETV